MTLDDLIALNDEMAALVRCGVPLEAGLAELGADLPGRLGRFAALLAQRTARGESLAQAITAEAGQLPPSYRAVVEAGIRAGRLPAALESVASSARRLSETHRAAVIAATYPLLVALVAWGGLILFTCVEAPRFAAAFRSLSVPGHQVFDALAWVGRGAWYWGPILPVAVVLLATAWCLTCTRAAAIEGRWGDWFFGRIPWMGRMVQCSRTAAFLELLALLVENETPLPEAMVLAAEASGDPSTLRSARQMAAAIEHGQAQPAPGEGMFPPLVNWLLMAAGRDGTLLSALRHGAAVYHRRARHQSDLVRLLLPMFLTVAVAGTVTALYALTLVAPYAAMFRAFGR